MMCRLYSTKGGGLLVEKRYDKGRLAPAPFLAIARSRSWAGQDVYSSLRTSQVMIIGRRQYCVRDRAPGAARFVSVSQHHKRGNER